MATGIGDETVWLCPTIDQTNPYDDLSSEGNDGTKVGSVSVVSSSGSGGSYAFSFPNFGSYNEYISFSSIGVTSADSYTCSMWIKAQDTGGTQIMFYGGQSSGLRFMSCQGTVYDKFEVGVNTDPLEAGEMADDTWQHVLFTYDRSSNGDTRLWLDGTEDQDTNESGTNSYGNQWLYLGRYGYEGLIDDFRCFDRVLTSSEIALLASERGYQAASTGIYDPFTNLHFTQAAGHIR